jgi:hypothetical protein
VLSTPKKRVANGDDIDAFAEGEDQLATAVFGRRRKRPRGSNTLEDIVNGDNEPACEAHTGPSRSARQTRRTRPPVPLAIESEDLGEIGEERREGRTLCFVCFSSSADADTDTGAVQSEFYGRGVESKTGTDRILID